MAHTLSFFMIPEDEVAFWRALEPLHLQVYPEVFPLDYQPFLATAANASRFTESAYYLNAVDAGEPCGRIVRKGPHKGLQEIDEIRSPVLHLERSFIDEDTGELRSGRLWGELEALGDRQRLLSKPDLLLALFDRVRDYFKKTYRRSNPQGFFIGPHAARRAAQGLSLREAGRKGELVVPYK